MKSRLCSLDNVISCPNSRNDSNRKNARFIFFFDEIFFSQVDRTNFNQSDVSLDRVRFQSTIVMICKTHSSKFFKLSKIKIHKTSFPSCKSTLFSFFSNKNSCIFYLFATVSTVFAWCWILSIIMQMNIVLSFQSTVLVMTIPHLKTMKYVFHCSFKA